MRVGLFSVRFFTGREFTMSSVSQSLGPKVYVSVDVAFDTDGHMRPVFLTWEDGTKYEIDRVIECCRAASMKAGGCGDRYTIRVGG